MGKLEGYEEFAPHKFRATGKFNRLQQDYKHIWVDGECYSRRVLSDVSYDYEDVAMSIDSRWKYLVRTLKKNGKKEVSGRKVEDEVISLAPFFSCDVENFDWEPFWSGSSFSVYHNPTKEFGKDFIHVTGSANPFIALAYGICEFYKLKTDYGRSSYLHYNQTDTKFVYDALTYGSGYSLSLMFELQDILNMDVQKWNFDENQLARLKFRLEDVDWLPKELFLVFKRPLTDIEKITIASKIFTNYSKKKKHYATSKY